jgi:hypothetical protein
MNENVNSDSVEKIITIGRIYSENDKMWLPCLKDEATHDIDPMWVAAVMYLILDRYTGCVPDEKQIEFYDVTLKLFETMKENGSQYIFKVKQPEE